MPRKASSKKTAKKTATRPVESRTYIERLESEVQNNQSRLSLILGALIVLVVGILVFNYFNRPKPEVGPSQQTNQQADVSPDNLPGKYTVKEGDTLFSVAEKYYNDGYKYTEIAKANNLEDVNQLTAGQVLDIPKLEAVASASPSVSPSETPTETPSESPLVVPSETPTRVSQGNTTWGPVITTNTYTVQEGDWLSKIADRAYGDPMAYQKLAQANNIANPDLIEPGMVLTIPH